MNFALGRLRDTTDDFQQRTFAGSVFTDYPDYFAWLDIKGDIPERPKIRIRNNRGMAATVASQLVNTVNLELFLPANILPPTLKLVAERRGADFTQTVFFRDAVYFDDRSSHVVMLTMKLGRARMERGLPH